MSMVETPVLGVGARGEQVRQLQQALLDAGITFRGGADGVFGPATQAALRQFQEQNNLAVTGTVDPETSAVLMPASGEGSVRTPEQQRFYDTLPPELKAILDDDEQMDSLVESFGEWSAFLYHEELGELLLKATSQGFSSRKFVTELRKTDWWDRTNNAIRAFDIREIENSGQVQREIEIKMQTVRDYVSGLGTRLPEVQIRELARNSLRLGYTDRELANAAGAAVYKVDGVTTLRTGMVGQQVREGARRFGVPLSDAAVDNFAKDIATGNQNFQDYENYLRRQAIGLFPSLQKEIERGMDVQTLADPYVQTAARVLGIAPETVDFADPKWNIALNFTDASGRRMMNLEEWTRHIRTNDDYGYQYTDDAHNKAYMATSTIARAFGRL